MAVGQGNHLFEVEPRFNPLDSRDISPHNDMLAAGGVLLFCQRNDAAGTSFHRCDLETAQLGNVPQAYHCEEMCSKRTIGYQKG